MAYSKGGKVQFADLNTFSSTFNTIWGIGSGNQGYGQTSTINTVSYGQKVRATNFWNTLVTNIQAIANHNGASIAPMTPSPTTAGKITFLNNISSNLTAINNSRLNAVASGSTSVTTLTSTQAWNDKMVVTINVTFESQNQARYYFNAGGQIGLSFSHPNTGSINTLISDICSEAGTLWISSPASGSVNISGTNYNGVTKIGGVASGRSVVNSNFGFYAFNTTAVQIFNQTGDTSPASYQATFLRVLAYTNNAGALTFVVTFDEVPNGITVSSGTNISVTLRPPSTAYISASWGSANVSGTFTYSNEPLTVYQNQNTSGTVQSAFTIPRGWGGVGEGFYRVVGSWTATYGGTVYVNYLTWAGPEKVWDMQFTRVRNGVRTVIQGNSYGSGAFYTGGNATNCFFSVPGPWVQYVGAVEVLPGDRLEGYCYLWGAFGGDLIEGGNFNVWATVEYNKIGNVAFGDPTVNRSTATRSGAAYSWTVPSGVNTLSIAAAGGGGGSYAYHDGGYCQHAYAGGPGGGVTNLAIPVVPGDIISGVYGSGGGSGYYNGGLGGPGSATTIYKNGVLVATCRAGGQATGSAPGTTTIASGYTGIPTTGSRQSAWLDACDGGYPYDNHYDPWSWVLGGGYPQSALGTVATQAPTLIGANFQRAGMPQVCGWVSITY